MNARFPPNFKVGKSKFPELGQNTLCNEIARPRLEKYANGNNNIKVRDTPNGSWRSSPHLSFLKKKVK